MQSSVGIVDIVTFILFPILAGLTLITVRRLFKTYKLKKENSILYFLTAFTLVLVGALVLATGVILTGILSGFNPNYVLTFSDEVIVRSTLMIGLAISTSALVLINFFSFENTFPDRKIPLMIIAAISGAAFVIVLVLANINGTFGGDLAVMLGSFPYYHPIIAILAVIAIAPSTISTPAVFLYYARKVRSMDEGRANRSLILGTGFLLTNVGYVIGTIIVGNLISYIILSLISRILVFISAIVILFCVIMPEWFKRMIKWKVD